ncbi:MAG: hypothetical protein DWG76_07665 [Chloroflexi bacterium]|nr:hypothetical protein [Chloroflexota bacterium]MQC27303.1 hypothetical protein [Chloroflexota bacterium]
MSDIGSSPTTSSALRQRLGTFIIVLGALLFFLGADPGFFGLDRSSVIGFVQITVFTFGLGLICLGGYYALDALWNGGQKSIAAEIGARLVGTGYVISLATGMADLFGLGTRPLPSLPFFGYWQARGVLIGEMVVVIGFLLMMPYWRQVYRWLRNLRKTN